MTSAAWAGTWTTTPWTDDASRVFRISGTKLTLISLVLEKGSFPTGSGGAFDNKDGEALVQHCTISGNSAPAGGGVAGRAALSSLTYFDHSIVYGNSGGDLDLSVPATLTFQSNGANFIGSGDGMSEFVEADDHVGTDPQLQPLADNTLVDTDGDGFTDAGEIADSTDPLDANSRLRITLFEITAMNPGFNATNIGFTSFPGLSYSAEFSSDLDFSDARVSGLGNATGFLFQTSINMAPTERFVRIRRNP